MSAEDEQATSEIKKLSLSDIASWDDYYDNPKAEIILVSNVRIGFRVDAWQFKKESTFIRDLTTFPSDQAIELALIELDHDSKIVRCFIDFLMTGSTSTVEISSMEFKQLFQLADKFMAEKVERSLLVAMEVRVQHSQASKDLDPWIAFKFAAERDHVDLARASIQAFERARLSHSDIYESHVPRFEGIPGKYVGGLLLAGYDMRHDFRNHKNTLEEVIERRTWSRVAANFNVE